MNLLENKKARLEYEILKEFEAGLELFGHEVKALRAKLGKLQGAYIVARTSGKAGGLEAYIIGMQIPAYQQANTPDSYDSERTRRLLLNTKELEELAGFEKQKGLTIVPISVYNKGQKLKLKVAVARGRKNYDKREVLKKRDTEREIDRTLKNR